MDTNFNDVFSRNYELVKIILVNSASYAYSEIPINEPLALFGKNNKGKTSSLAATKLLLYPEINFNDCAKKFNFTMKSGELYNKEESYRYYFPSAESFIALEVVNPKGTFTMLLYKVGNYEYHRLFFPCEYSVIRPLIWDESTQKTVEALSLGVLLEFAKDIGGIQMSSKAQIQKMIYGNFGSKTSQYCIVPIKDQEDASVDAFRKMYELAFDSGKGEKEKLPNAIATIIEMQRTDDKQKLDEDVYGLKDKRSALAATGAKIKSLVDNEVLYRSIQERFDVLHSDALTAVIDLSIFNHLLSERLQDHSENVATLFAAKSAIEADTRALKAAAASIYQTKTTLTGQIALINEGIARKRARLASAHTVLGQYPTLTKRQVSDKMQSEVDEHKRTAEALRSQEATTKRMTEKTREQNNLKNKLKQLEKSLSNTDSLIAARLPIYSANVLGSLNPAFIRASTDNAISDDDLSTIDRFVSLFSIDGQDMGFIGAHMQDVIYKPYDVKEQSARIADDINLTKEKLMLAGETIKNLNKSLAEVDLGQARITEDAINKEINVLVDTIRLLDGLDTIELNIVEQERELVDKSSKLDIATTSHQLKYDALQELNSKYVQATDEYEKIKRFEQDARLMEDMVKGVRNAHGMPYLSSSSPDFDALLEETDITVDLKTASSITTYMADIQQQVVTLIKDVFDFIRRVVIDDVNPNQQIDTLNQLGDVISKYKNSFSRLEWQQKNFYDETRTHNNVIDGLLKEITDAARLLRTTIASLNNRLNEHQISNLSKVSMRLNLSPDFANLERTHQKHSIDETSLLDESFYQSLIYYVERSSHSNSCRLKINNLIQSITYEYESAAGELDTKGQSGGTTSTITALIATLLFTDVFLPHSILNVPIIVDEVASIDKDNIKSVFERVTQAGFTLIVANPSLHADTLRFIKKYVYVDKTVLNGIVKVPACELVLTADSIQYLGEVSHED